MKSQSTKSEAVRPRVLGLNADRIATAALDILDRDGLKALSARRLANDLGCEAMSLYSHIASMDAVYDLVVDRLLSTLPTAVGLPDPRQAIRVEALEFLSMAETHPHAFGLVATRRWRTPVALAFAKRLVSRLIETGLSPRASLRHARIIGVFLNGAGLGLASWRLIPGETESKSWQMIIPNQVSDAQSVRADLIVGLDAILDALGKEVVDTGRKTQSIT